MKVKNIKIILGILFVTIGIVGEILVKKFIPQRTWRKIQEADLACYQKSSYLPFEFKPGCSDWVEMAGKKFEIKINNIGFRGKDIGEKKDKRVLLMGDSFVFGFGVEDGEKIGDFLNQKNLQTEVVSAGFTGNIGPDTTYLYLANQALALKPDLVIITMFPYKDISDIGRTTWEIENDQLTKIVMSKGGVDKDGTIFPKDIPSYYQLPVLRNSHLALFLFNKIKSITANLEQRIKIRLKIETNSSFLMNQFKECLYNSNCEGAWETRKIKTASIVRGLKQWEKKNNLKVVVVLIPLREQVIGLEPPKTIFHELLDSNQLVYLDLADYFTNVPQPHNLYFPDGHLNAYGNEEAAKAIQDWIQKLQLLRT